jgi:hypothetical protein
MKFFKRAMQLISWLSIDVVFGAMAGMLFFSELLHIRLEWGIYGLLAAAVWSIYTLDHLWDARRDAVHLSYRHQVHRRYGRLLLGVLLIVVVFGGVGAIWILGLGRELLLSGILAGVIVLSRYLIWKAGASLSWLKELSIAVYYVLGIAWMPLLRAEPLDRVWEVYGFFGAYLGLAFLNLLMLSFLDRREDQSAGFTSAAQAIPPLRMVALIRRLAFGLIFLSLAGFILLPSFYRSFSCLILMMSLVHYLNFFNAGLSPSEKRMRMEAAFGIPWLLIFL